MLDPDWAARWGGRSRDKLWQDVQEDPDAYGLRSRMTVMGREFVLAFAGLRERAGAQAGLVIVDQFTNRVAGAGTGVVDAIGRRAAVRAGERLFSATTDTLFCLEMLSHRWTSVSCCRRALDPRLLQRIGPEVAGGFDPDWGVSAIG